MLQSCFITTSRKNYRETQKNAQSAKINNRKNFVPHGTPTKVALYRPSIIIFIYVQFQFKQFNETRGLGLCPVWEWVQQGYFLSYAVSNFSFSYNTLFLSSLGFMAVQYTPSGVQLIKFHLKLRGNLDVRFLLSDV